MTKMSLEQIRQKYGRGAYLCVCGSAGDMFPPYDLSETQAVELYNRTMGKASCIIVCVPSETHGRICYRGWIDDTRWKWLDDPESLAIEPIKPAKPTKRRKPPKKRETADGITCTMDVHGSDIVITDPCYLFNEQGWKEFRAIVGDGRAKPQCRYLQGMNMLFADTIYGDWMCELRGKFNGDCRHKFGKFTADSGMVCIAAHPNDEAVEKLEKLPAHCWVRIPKFFGAAQIVHRKGECLVHGVGTSDGVHVEFRNYQIA